MKDLKLIPLGGTGEIGKNMTVLSQGDDMIVIDAGLSFPTEEMHGIDIVIPDFTYLLENQDRLRAIILTHGHEDHIGALPYVLDKLSVPVYASKLTLEFAKRKLSEKIPSKSYVLKEYGPDTMIEAGSFVVEPIYVTHSIPDTYSLAIRTEVGNVIFTGDFKFDFTPVDGQLTNLTRFAELGDEGVTVLVCDSTNSEYQGWGPSESSVDSGFEEVFQNAEGRILATLFASNVHRIQQILNAADKHGRKVAVAGRRMEQTINIARSIKRLFVPEDVLIRLDECDLYPDHRIVILTTGSQGEPLSALSLMAKSEYPKMQIKSGDTVVYSARPIPGNESAIWQTINRLFRQGAVVVYGEEYQAHASGHAYQEELKMMINLTRPSYIVPVHGEPRHQHYFKRLAKQMGYDDSNIIILENGIQLVFEQAGAYIGERVHCGRICVDSSGYAGVSDEVLRDRRNLANDGVVLIHAVIDTDAGKVITYPEAIAKGLATSNGEIELLENILREKIDNLSHAELHDITSVEEEVNNTARQFLKKRVNKHPLVIATVIDV